VYAAERIIQSSITTRDSATAGSDCNGPDITTVTAKTPPLLRCGLSSKFFGYLRTDRHTIITLAQKLTSSQPISAERNHKQNGNENKSKQSVDRTGRNRTGPPCSVGRRPGHAPGPAAANRPRVRRMAALQTTTEDADRRQTPTDGSVQNNTDPLGGPVTNIARAEETIQIIVSTWSQCRFVKAIGFKRRVHE